jgi:hypothetical protein
MPAREQWTSALRQHQLEGLLNTYDPNPAESGTATYNLRTVPQLFLLDNRKTIRYKQIGAEQVEGVMERMVGSRE